MKIKLWIIYKSGIGFSKFIAERIQDQLEDFIDVYVGSANMIDPKFIIEEKFEYLIIGDVIDEVLPSLEIQNWLLKYRENTQINNLIIKIFSGFYVAHPNIKIEPFWTEFLQEHINAEMTFPPVLSLKLRRADLTLEIGSLELVKAYSNDIIELLVNS
ncbi:MAG: hypothetical protein ACFFB8_06430 [Promethearchaeota archaeon]